MERLMAGRRTRELFFGGFILLMLSLQLVGPLLNRYGDSAEPLLVRALAVPFVLSGIASGKGVGAAAGGNYGGFRACRRSDCLLPGVFWRAVMDALCCAVSRGRVERNSSGRKN